jgi:hypothetical protein
MNKAAYGADTLLAQFFPEFEKVGVFFDPVVTADDKGIKDKICG